MAKGRKVKGQAAVMDATSDYKGGTLVNVLRVPRIKGGAWEKSPKGSLLLDTLCFPITTAVEVVKKSKTDPAWVVKVGDKEMTAEQARPLSIGDSVLTDTTTGKRYLVRDAQGMDALPEEAKKAILRKTRRRTTIMRAKVCRKLLQSIIKIPSLGDCFNDDERAEIFNKLAQDVNTLRDHLYKVARKQEDYFTLKA